MEVAPTPIVCQLTGLSTVKLREWTSRRALIPADIPAPKRGAPALYSWQTVLVLRLAIVLRDTFHVELTSQKALFERLRAELQERSFAALTGKSLVIAGDGQWRIIEPDRLPRHTDDCLILGLDPHLSVIGEVFAMADLGISRRRKAA
jgi:hypothetical protein